MEFDYRAVDEPPPSSPLLPCTRPTTSSSGCSCSSQQPIKAGYRIPSSERANEYFNLGPGQANDCCNVGFGQVNEYTRNPLDVREAIQKELEKERVREEIIAAEIACRQSLEAEVGREMMIERELALRARRGQVNAFDRFSFTFGGGMEFEPRDVSFLHNKGLLSEERIAMSLEEMLGMRERSETGRLVTVPFHHGSIEPKIKEVMSCPADVKKDKDKIVILAEPDASLSGAKQRAVPPTEEGASNFFGGVSKKKLKAEWSCELCQVSITTERGLNDHIQGKKHKSRAAALRAQTNVNNIGIGTFPRKDIDPSVETTHKIGSEMGLKSRGELLQYRESSLQINSSTERVKENNVSILEESDKTDNTRKENLGVQKALKKEQKEKKRCTFWCEMCQVGAHSENVMEAHRKGRKHVRRLQEAEENDTTNRIPQNAGIQEVNDAEEAAIEGNDINNKETDVAKPDAALSGAKQNAIPPEEEGASDLSGGVSKNKVKEEWSCELCQVSATTERGLNNHIQGKKHKSRAAALRVQTNGNSIGIGTFPNKDIDPSVEITHKIGLEMGLKSRGDLSQFRESSLQINSSTERIKENIVSILEESDKTDNTRKENLGVQKAPKKEQKEKKVCTFWCEMCQVGADNETVMEAHRKGKKHVRRLQEAEKTDTTNRTPQNARIQGVNDAEEATIEGNNINNKEADVAKPDAAVSGAKQKAVPPEEEGACDLSGGVSKNKVKEEWSCELCQVSATTERGLNNHIHGKKHKSRAAALRVQTNGNNIGIGTFPSKDIDPSVEITHKIGSEMGLKSRGDLSQFRESSLQINSSKERIKENIVSIFQESDKTDNTRKENLGVQKAPKKEQKEKKVCTFWCEMCQVGAHNENVMEAHRKGKKHMRRLQEAEENDATNRTPQNASIQVVNDTEKTTMEGNNINNKEADVAKPDAALSGPKQKAVPPEEEGASDLSGGVSKKKMKKEWSCELCQVSATTERGLNGHIQGKKHKSRAAALRAQTNGNNIGIGTFPRKDIDPSVEITNKISSDMGLKSRGELSQFRESLLQINSSTEWIKENNVSIFEESDKTDNPRKENLGVQKVPKKEQKEKKVYTFWCEMCQVGADNGNVMEAHRKGKKHMRRLQEAEENDTTNQTPQNASIQAVNDAEEATIEGININIKEADVAKPDAAVSGAKQKAVPPEEEGVCDLSGGVSKNKVKEEWSCELCQVSATTECGLNNHIQGKKHKSRAAALRVQTNGNNTGIGTFPSKDIDPSVEITHKIGSEMGLKSRVELSQFRESSFQINSGPERIKENNVSVLEESDKMDNTRKENLGVQKAPKKEQKEGRVYTFWCEMCQVGTDNENVMEAHRKGKKHMAQLQEAEENVTNNRTPQNVSSQAANDGDVSNLVASLLEAVQKAIPLEEEGVRDLSGGVSKKKVKEEWSCVLCRVGAMSERGLNNHIQGKKHKSKAAALRAQINDNNIGIGTFPRKDINPSVEITHKISSEMGLKPRGELSQINQTRESSLQINSSTEWIKENNVSILEESDKTDNTMKENLGIQKAPKKELKERKVCTFWCEMCQVGADNENVMEAHRKGKKHVRRLQESEENDTTNRTPQNAGILAVNDADEDAVDGDNINIEDADVVKPDASIWGAKQNAVPPEEEGANDISGGASKKNVKEERGCVVC